MRIRYGGYTHAVDEASVVIRKEKIESNLGLILGYKETWTINGEIFADTPDDITQALKELENAYSLNGYDLELLDNDLNPTQHYLISHLAKGGVRIKSLSYPEGRGGAEYNTQRTYQIEVEATFLITTTSPNKLLSFKQEITYTGTGGPRFVVREYRNGPPIRQFVSEFTPCRASQSGSLQTHNPNELPPQPIWPEHENQEARQVSTSANEAIPPVYTINWNYSFTSAAPF